MSTVEIDFDERFWEMYLSDCRALETTPKLSDYSVWLSDHSYEEDNEGY